MKDTAPYAKFRLVRMVTARGFTGPYACADCLSLRPRYAILLRCDKMFVLRLREYKIKIQEAWNWKQLKQNGSQTCRSLVFLRYESDTWTVALWRDSEPSNFAYSATGLWRSVKVNYFTVLADMYCCLPLAPAKLTCLFLLVVCCAFQVSTHRVDGGNAVLVEV